MGTIVARISTAKKFAHLKVKPTVYYVSIRKQDPAGRIHKLNETFDTKAAANAWMIEEEAKIMAGGRIINDGSKTLRHVIALRKVKVSKGDRRLLERWCDRDPLPFIDKSLTAILPVDIEEWAAKRLDEKTDDDANPGALKRVEPSTVRREWNTLAATFTYAVAMLKWLAVSPVPRKIRGSNDDPRPRDNPARRRRVSDAEVAAVYAAAELTPEGTIESHTHRAALAFELAIETTLRTGELVQLAADRINFENRTAVVVQGKTGGDEKEISLSSRAIEIIRRLLAASADGRALPMAAHYLTRMGTALRRKAGLKNLRGHDGRAEGTTRLSKVFTLPQLAQQTGHRDPRMLMVYYRETAADRAKLLP